MSIDDSINDLAREAGYGTLGNLVSACAESERVTDGQALRFMERLAEGNNSVQTTADIIWDRIIGPALDELATEIKETVK
jgi:hypothetical protein